MAKFTIFCRRWGHEDSYDLKKTEDGWFFQHLSYNGDCNSKGEPVLYDALDHDSINYPKDLGGYLDFLWRQANETDMSEEEIQEYLNELASWVSKVEQGISSSVFFKDYN